MCSCKHITMPGAGEGRQFQLGTAENGRPPRARGGRARLRIPQVTYPCPPRARGGRCCTTVAPVSACWTSWPYAWTYGQRCTLPTCPRYGATLPTGGRPSGLTRCACRIPFEFPSPGRAAAALACAATSCGGLGRLCRREEGRERRAKLTPTHIDAGSVLCPEACRRSVGRSP